MSFAPGELSTIVQRGPEETSIEYRAFNPDELPCPPPDVVVPPGQKYKPLISPPPQLFSLDPNFSTCIPGKLQGVDPWTPLNPGGYKGTGGGRGGGRPKRRDLLSHPRVTPAPEPKRRY